MTSLFIDTSLKDIIIKYFDDYKIISEESVCGQKNNSQFIMPTIKKVLDGQKPDQIIVVNGPGSFTGVRLGVTIAKSFSYALNIPIKTLTSLELRAISLSDKQKIIAISDGNGFYLGMFDEYNNLIGEYKYLKNGEYELFAKQYDVKTDVTIDYNFMIKYMDKKEETNCHLVKPIYIKKIGVEHDTPSE